MMEKEKKKKGKVKPKQTKQTSKIKLDGQHIFVIVSLSILILIGTLIGGKSLYYYSKQNQKIKVESKLLATIIKKNNTPVTEGDGLYKDGQNYLFKGKVENNYVMYSNMLWRVLKLNDDNTVRLISEDSQTNMIWGDESAYLSSSVYKWLNKNDEVEHTGILHESLANPSKYLTTSTWCEDTVVEGKVECKKSDTSDLYTILTLEEYMDAGSENSFLNNGSSAWLLGVNAEDEKIVLNKSGKITTAPSYEGYGIRPIITINDKVDVVSGTGTKEDPYKIELEEDKTMYRRYVKLGEDLYQIYDIENENILKLSLTDYLKANGEYYQSIYSYSDNTFDMNNRYNIAYYLNNRYYNNLPYKDVLSDCTFYHGELSDEKGYQYLNLYENPITAKVGLLTTQDIKVTPLLSNYYLMDKTSSYGEMAYFHQNDGKLMESLTNEKRSVVPSVCIDKTKLTQGDGTMENPYVME